MTAAPDPPGIPDPDARVPLARRNARAQSDDARRWRWVALGVVVVVVVSVVLVRVFVVERLWPETRVQALLDDAADAVAVGHLSDAEGGGARQLYEAALALDPDDVRPR
ncbi:MAG: hypothetical protein ABW163_10250, partial [Luteimonas sp.]